MPATEPVPLTADADGVIRVGKTRVTLDTVVAAYLEGCSAEDIVEQYSTLSLAETYAVIAYYLRHEMEVNRYLSQHRQQAAEVRANVERRFPPDSVRARLHSRRRAK